MGIKIDCVRIYERFCHLDPSRAQVLQIDFGVCSGFVPNLEHLQLGVTCAFWLDLILNIFGLIFWIHPSELQCLQWMCLWW